jgi:hypothetical protein
VASRYSISAAKLRPEALLTFSRATFSAEFVRIDITLCLISSA